MEAAYAESITINQSFWTEADTDTRFYAGDQSIFSDFYGNLPANRRRQMAFNRIRRTIMMPVGYQRRNRKSMTFTPIENGDTETADQFTKIAMWLNQHENVLETISEAFEGAMITGMNLLHVWPDYRTDPVCGNLKVDKCSYNSFLIDPFFRKHDLSDCNFIWKRTFLTKRECVSLFPDQANDIMSLYGVDNRDGKFQYMPESYNYGLKNLLTYDEYWYRDYRSQKMLIDSETGETMEWKDVASDQSEQRLKKFLRAYPQVVVVDQEIPTVKLGVIIQGKVFYDGPNPLGIDLYPFVPVLGYYTPEMPYFPWRVQGMVRGLRDAQFLYNRRRIIELDILESQITSGFKYKENALVNPMDIFLSGQGRGLALKEEALMTDVEQIIPPSIPESMIQLSELLGQEIMEISGVNEELLGSAEDDKAGILSMLRQGAGLTTLQNLFDQLDYSQKLLGNIFLQYAQNNFTPAKVKKILGGQEPTQEFYNKNFGRYHCTVSAGLNTDTQRQEQFIQLMGLRELGLQIPDDLLLEASTLQNKKQLIEAVMKQSQQAQQMQQAQAEAALQEQQANIKVAESVATANEGLGLERLSRVEQNQAMVLERQASAKLKEDQGLYDMVKALKELESMEIGHVKSLLEGVDILKQHEFKDREMLNGTLKEKSDNSSGSKSPNGKV